MALGEGPGGEVHFDIERANLVGHQLFRVRSILALRAVESRSGDLGDSAVGSYVREACEPIGQRGGRTRLKKGVGASEDGQVRFERSGIVSEAVGVDWSRIGEQLSPPESGLYANRWNIAKLVHPGLGEFGVKRVSVVEIERCIRHVPWRPANFTAPLARHNFQVGVGEVPVL